MRFTTLNILSTLLILGSSVQAVPNPAPELEDRQVRQAGQCGTSAGWKCDAGFCCSSAGYCGQSSDYCGNGCQGQFGQCNTPAGVRQPGQCGGSGQWHCDAGYCCSQYGYCGTTDQYCLASAGCQSAFGTCR